jgi:hypothetical protein
MDGTKTNPLLEQEASLPNSDRERRRQPRIHPETKIYVEYPHQASHVRDVSLTGAFIEERLLGPGRVFELKIFLGESEPVTATVIVRRVDEQRGMGVEFLHVDEADYQRLRKFVNSPRRDSRDR